MIVSLGNYGNYSSDNYAAHCLRLTLGDLTLYFSYRTVVAFEEGFKMYVSENCWGPTTGKHLKWIDDGCKKSRLKRDKFEELLEKVLMEKGITI